MHERVSYARVGFMYEVPQGPLLDPLFFYHMLPPAYIFQTIGLDFHVFADDTQLCVIDTLCDTLPATESNPDCCQFALSTW